MRLFCLAATAAVLAGCAEKPKVAEAPPPPELTRDDCYTVVLFDDVEIVEPAEAVPAEHRAFLGYWQKGAWGGKWCHDILISAVHPDGSAEVFDMHAPYEPWSQPATAFRRKGRIDDKGVLRFRHDTVTRAYRLVDGRLHAKRSGQLGELEAVLVDPGTATALAEAASAEPEEATPLAAPQVSLNTGPSLGETGPTLALSDLDTAVTKPPLSAFAPAERAPAASASPSIAPLLAAPKPPEKADEGY